MADPIIFDSFTSGEISEDAWDRVTLQPVQKGCELGQNFVIQVAGPLAKRRGFWDLTTVDPTSPCRLIPFRKSLSDAFMLQLTAGSLRVWSANGTPYNFPNGQQVQIGTPFTADLLAGLRYKQVGDVIYLRHSAGVMRPQTLVRYSDTDWRIFQQSFLNGPWLAENTDQTQLVEVRGNADRDANPNTNAACMMAGTDITLSASPGMSLFQPGHVGALFRLRQNAGAPSVMGWTAANQALRLGYYCISDGRVYRCDQHPSTSGSIGDGSDPMHLATRPPLGDALLQSDGACQWAYRHDGAGVVQITHVIDATHAAAHVLSGVPMADGEATSWWSEGAYSDVRGWPRAWPTMREERLVEASTSANKDMVDLTGTASFGPSSADFKPGLGTGQVVDTDAIRRRVGDGGSRVLWAVNSTYLVLGADDGIYTVSGSVLDEPLSPSAVMVKRKLRYGSADVKPAEAHSGIIFAMGTGKALREVSIDENQQVSTDDLTVLARHVGDRGFSQLEWVKEPDEVLWQRMADGGLVAMTYHKEQQVRGFTTQALPGGWTCEDMAVIPGPGQLETLWLVVSRTKQGTGLQRRLWMLSQPSDQLFLDCAAYYSGPPTTNIGGLNHLIGETVRVVADGAQLTADLAVNNAGHITLPKAASVVTVGLAYVARFKSLRLTGEDGVASRQRPTQATVSLTCVTASVGADGASQLERVSTRQGSRDPPAATRVSRSVSIAADTGRDPRIVVESDDAYDCRINLIRAKVA